MEKIVFNIIKELFSNEDTIVSFGSLEELLEVNLIEDNSSGCHYDHSECINIFSYNTKDGLQKRDWHHRVPYASQNANGTWNTEDAFNASDIPESSINDDSFVIVEYITSYSDCNGRDDYSHGVTFYPLKGLKQLNAETEAEACEKLMTQIEAWVKKSSL